MNKFRRFLSRISAETWLKIDSFGNKSPDGQALGDPPPDPRLGSMTREVQLRPYSH